MDEKLFNMNVNMGFIFMDNVLSHYNRDVTPQIFQSRLKLLTTVSPYDLVYYSPLE
jgi:hypothetical protein